MNDWYTEIQQKASNANIQQALFRLESAVVVAGTLLLTFLLPRPFPWWPVWAWPVLGLLAWAIVIYSSLTDPDTYGTVIWQLLCEKLPVKLIEDATMRRQVNAALAYQRRIEAAAYRYRDQADIHPQLAALAERFAAWMELLHRLARYQDTYTRDYRIADLRKQLPQEIESLVSRRKFERNPQIQQRLDAALEEVGRAWETLRLLEAEMQQGPARMTQQLSDLERLYGEVQPLAAQLKLAGGIGNRLQNDIQEQVERLSGVLQNIDRLYSAALEASHARKT